MTDNGRDEIDFKLGNVVVAVVDEEMGAGAVWSDLECQHLACLDRQRGHLHDLPLSLMSVGQSQLRHNVSVILRIPLDDEHALAEPNWLESDHIFDSFLSFVVVGE